MRWLLVSSIPAIAIAKLSENNYLNVPKIEISAHVAECPSTKYCETIVTPDEAKNKALNECNRELTDKKAELANAQALILQADDSCTQSDQHGNHKATATIIFVK